MPARAAALCFLLVVVAAGTPAGAEIRVTPAPAGLPASVTVPAESADAALANAERVLADAGFVWPTVEVESAMAGVEPVIRYRVRPGIQAIIGGWSFAGADSIDQSRLAAALPRRGERFTAQSLRLAMDEVAAVYARAGFPLARVEAASVRESVPFVVPTLNVTEGPRVFVRRLDFAGRSLPKPALLLRAARFRPTGYTPAQVAAWRRQLDRSGLVRTDSQALTATALVSPQPAGSAGLEYGVQLWLTALRANRAMAAVGWSPDDRKLTGFAEVALGNLFDTGRRLAAAWRSGYGRVGFSASYTEPQLLNSGFDVSVSAHQDAQDSTYSRTDLAIQAVHAAAGGMDVSGSGGFERDVDVAPAGNARTLWVGTGIEIDTRDYPANPRRGFRFAATTRAGERSADSTPAQFVNSTELDVAEFLPFGRTMSLTGRLGARAIYSRSRLLTSELFTLGGANTVRGYRDEQFRSRLLGWGSIEPAAYLGPSSRAYPFVDAGAFTDETGWHVVFGYGVGARVATRAGAVGFDYGVAFGENPLSGKVHLSFDAEF